MAVVENCEQLHLQKFLALEKELLKHNLLLSVFLNEGKNSYQELMRRLTLNQPAGVVLIANYKEQDSQSSHAKICKFFENSKIPFVAIDIEFENINHVVFDRENTVYNSLMKLSSKNYQNIAYAGIRSAFGNEERKSGYCKAMKELQMDENIYEYEKVGKIDYFDAAKRALNFF